MENFEFFRRSKEFWEIFGRTVAYNVWFLFIGLVSAVGIAILFYSLSSKRLVKVYSTISILPRFMSAVLLSYLVYAFLNPVSGILNKIIEALGGTSIDWYMKPEPWPIIITFVKVWSSVGMSCLIYYATLVGIDASLFEAARLDGATRWQEMRYIEIPELSSVICINLIMGINGIVQGGDFDMFYTLTKDSAALYPTTNIIGTYMYRALMVNNDIGTTSALGVAQSVVGLILLLITNGVIRKISYDNRLF